jgi:hypothetical protein
LKQAKERGEEEFRKAALSLMERTFSEVSELKAVHDEARAAMRTLNRTDRELADALNHAIRERISRGASENAALVREAFESIGIQLVNRRR